MKNATQLIFMLLNEMRKDVIYLITIMYELNEQNDFDNKKLNIKSSSRPLIKAFKKKLNVESTKIFTIKASNLLRQIKSVYKYDNVIQNII